VEDGGGVEVGGSKVGAGRNVFVGWGLIDGWMFVAVAACATISGVLLGDIWLLAGIRRALEAKTSITPVAANISARKAEVERMIVVDFMTAP